MSGIPPPTRSVPTISTSHPPVLIDFVSNVPAPVTRLLIEQAGTIKVLRRAAEIASWKSSKASESWILLAVWWFICASACFGVRFLTPLLIISPALWRRLIAQTWWPWHGKSASHEPIAASDTTVASTISDITALRLLLPPFLLTATSVPPRLSILDTIGLSHDSLPLRSLFRAVAILYVPYLLVTWLVPLPVIFGIFGTVVLTIRAPWVRVIRQHVSESGWARWIWRRVWAFLTDTPVSTFRLEAKSPAGTKPTKSDAKKRISVAEAIQPAKLRFRFDILENQRWWVGIDWTSALLPNERTSWCSPPPNLVPLSPPITFSLPAPSTHVDESLKIRRHAFWRWDDPEWTVLVKTSHDGHHSRVHLPLPDVSIDSESRLAKGLKRVGESLPESATSAGSGRRSIEQGKDDEHREVSPSPSALTKEPLTDPDGWIYADNKWEGPSPKAGMGRYTRYRVWSRCAVLIEEIEDLEDGDPTTTSQSPITDAPQPSNQTDKSTDHHDHRRKGHKPAASEDFLASGKRQDIGRSSSVSDRESRLTSRLKSVLETRGGSKS